MRRYGFGVGYSINTKEGAGGSLAEPTGFVAKYTAYNVANFSLDVGSEVTQWNDESVNGNDLSSTGANRPTLIQNANTYLNRVVFDGVDDFMEGLPPQTGNFTYVFDLDVSNTAQTEYIFSGMDSSALLLLSDNNFYLRQSTSASDQALGTEDIQAGSNVYTLVKDGDDVRWYVNSILKATLDVTGRSFNFNTVGANADSMGSFNSLLNVFDRVLTQTEIDYYSYLRSETGEILLPPLLQS